MALRETKNVEYKSDITNTFLKTVSAFANYGGGTIIFGISGIGTIVGIDDPKSTALAIENKINDSIHPIPKFELNIDNSAHTVVLRVFEGNGKPRIIVMKACRQKLKELSFRILERKLIEELQIEGLTKDILKTLNLYSDKDGYNHAAELFSDKNTFPGVDIVRFGRNIDALGMLDLRF